jgi:magnesium chelatase subunit D
MNNSHKAAKIGIARKPKFEAQPDPRCYPFSAIVAQEEMKLALILNVVSSSIGGVLIMGHRGTGKSTVVRALADLLPEISIVIGCAFHCDPADQQSLCGACRKEIGDGRKLRRQKAHVPVVDLPLGATEDRVCGTIDIEQALRSGSKRFEPGLLARANRGFLYIDEVNLLEDHLVDLLLDVAATGVNTVERESISVEHPARFVLIGSGNPEEGELRPQLLDRFGVYVEVKTEEELGRRVEIMERREAFERHPESFCARFAHDQEELRRRIARAVKSFPTVKIDRTVLQDIARLCSELKVDGHRGELTISRAARSLAAFEGRKKVTEDDVRRVAVMSLRHRLRRNALEETAGAERIEQALDQVFRKASAGAGRDNGPADSSGDGGTDKRRRQPNSNVDDASPGAGSNGSRNATPNGSRGAEAPDQASQASGAAVERNPPKLRFGKSAPNNQVTTPSRLQSSRGGNRSVYNNERGRYARSVTSKELSGKLALDATLRAAAGFGLSVRSQWRRADNQPATSLAIPAAALRFKLFKRKQGRLFIFAIDLSGSMALNRLAHAKGAILALLRDSYIQRDSVAIVGFRGTLAELMLPPSRSILRARRVLDSVGVGGGTPLSAGLARALELSKQVGSKAGEIVLLVFTDGQANVALTAGVDQNRATRQRQIDIEIVLLGAALRASGVTTAVVATRERYRSNDAAERIASKLGARCSYHFV